MIRPRTFVLLGSLALLGSLLPADAQWQTQSFVVKPGLTAVYLHVDASYTNLDSLIGSDPNNPIAEVWLWVAPSTIQYVTSPQTPITGSSVTTYQIQPKARYGRRCDARHTTAEIVRTSNAAPATGQMEKLLGYE